MLYDRLEHFRRVLLGRRISLLQRRKQVLTEEQALLAEPEPDWEDAAAARTAASALETMSETERQTLDRIQAALQRIERGTYGECISCHQAIDEQRLRIIPETDCCERCAPTP